MSERTARSGERGPRRAARSLPPGVEEVRLGRRGLLWLGAAIGVITLGFVALALGSTTLAPILLVGGYLVLVPYALLARANGA